MLRGVVCLAGLLPVAPVLGWAFGIAPFATFFWSLTVPALVVLVFIGWRSRSWEDRTIRRIIAAGTLGGFLGTVAYDLVRVPFSELGVRVFAPIESYGVLLSDAVSSSPLSDALGWAYHFSNGIGFGIAFAAVMVGRPWYWGIVWGLILETVTIVTPFAATYGLAGKWGLIALAFGAHVAYGAPLGLVVQDAPERSWDRPLPSVLVAMVVITIAIWAHPWTVPAAVDAGRQVARGPGAIIVGGRFHPEWLRVAEGECATVENRDPRPYRIASTPPVVVAARERVELCPYGSGVHRIRTSGAPYSGGFVIVDETSRAP